jgi:phosphorylcholine metabolism protein LicD
MSQNDNTSVSKIIKIELNEQNINDYNLSEIYLNELKILFTNVIKILDKYNIKYWIDGGTLLGCVRDKSQIPYDNDTDLGVMKKDFDKIYKIENEFTSLGYLFKVENKLFIKIISNKIGIKYEHIEKTIVPCVDIVMHEIVKENGISKVLISDINFRKLYPNSFHYLSHLLPLKRYFYSDIVVMGPKNPYPYLNRQYPEWDKKRIFEGKMYI